MAKMRRTLCIFLSLLMLSASMASCSDNSSSGKETTPSGGNDTPSQSSSESESTEAETVEERIKPDIPETGDYGDDEILFLYWTNPEWSTTVRESRDIYSDGVTGEGINDAVYNRNLKIESAYKVKIALEKMNLGEIPGAVRKNITAGDGLYDVVVPRIAEIPGMITNNMLLNLQDVPNIDLTKPWYDQNCVSSYTIAGKLNCVASSLLINDKDCTAGLTFNKDIQKDVGLEDIYALVKEGTWTFDKLSELAEKAGRDTDGDGEITEDDIYGFLGGRDVMESFYYGSGEKLVASTEDGGLAFAFGQTERSVDAATKVIKMMQQKWFMNHHLIKNTDDIYYRQLFETGHGLFFWTRLDGITDMRAGEADFGIVPTPKYEESQANYYNLVSKHTGGLLTIPKSTAGAQLEEVTVVLEALTAESHYTLIPEYVESSLKTKGARDAESGPMVEIIINNRVFDPGYLHDFGGMSSWLLNLGDKDNSGTVASTAEKKVKVTNKAIDKFIDNLEKSE